MIVTTSWPEIIAYIFLFFIMWYFTAELVSYIYNKIKSIKEENKIKKERQEREKKFKELQENWFFDELIEKDDWMRRIRNFLDTL